MSTKSVGEGSGSFDSLDRSSGAILASSSATRSSGDDFFSGSWLSDSASYTTFGFITIFFFGLILSLALGFAFIFSSTLAFGFGAKISFGSSSFGSSAFGSSAFGSSGFGSSGLITSYFGSSFGVSSTGLAFFLIADVLITLFFLTAAFFGATFFLLTFLGAFLAGFFLTTGAFHSVPSSLSLYVPLRDVISPESSLSDAFAYLSGSRVLASTATASSLISLLSVVVTL